LVTKKEQPRQDGGEKVREQHPQLKKQGRQQKNDKEGNVVRKGLQAGADRRDEGWKQTERDKEIKCDPGTIEKN